MIYQERVYRKLIKAEGLEKFEVVQKETDLLILAERSLKKEAQKSIHKHRSELEEYIKGDPIFLTTFSPHKVKSDAPKIVRDMAYGAKFAKVGPMAAVAGVIAEHVGRDLLKRSKEVIVENGGDIFMKIKNKRKIGIYAPPSPFSEKIAIEIDGRETPLSICTSAGTIGHSISFGKADAVVVTSRHGGIADAAATAIGNRIKTPQDINSAIDFAKKIKGLRGVLIIKGEELGVWGSMKIVPI